MSNQCRAGMATVWLLPIAGKPTVRIRFVSARYVRNQSRVSGPILIRLRLHGPCLFERSVDGEERAP